MKKGRPMIYETEDEIEQVFRDYLEDAKKKHEMPNVAGFVVFADIGRTTFYDYQKHFPNTYERIQGILENATINARIGDSFKQFYMKNKFGYRDKQEIESENKNVNMTYEEYIKKVGDKDAY
jgi:hypothetical protein